MIGGGPSRRRSGASTINGVDLQTTSHEFGQGIVVALDGIADLSTLPGLQDHLWHAIDAHRGAAITVDLDGLVVLGDAALGLLLGAAARAREGGGSLTIVATSTAIRQRLADTRLDQIVAVHTSLAASQGPTP